MGAVSVIGGLSALRLPETLHCPLPQTAEEGELFGKDWTYADCCKCGEQRYTLWYTKTFLSNSNSKKYSMYSMYLKIQENDKDIIETSQKII